MVESFNCTKVAIFIENHWYKNHFWIFQLSIWQQPGENQGTSTTNESYQYICGETSKNEFITMIITP